ncbi:hypothetical protein ON010_g11752 [Phytophthora cinnamomi]|nr:hypothetical protein ON010_g11752 [Phytophthora cinnamomi]
MAKPTACAARVARHTIRMITKRTALGPPIRKRKHSQLTLEELEDKETFERKKRNAATAVRNEKAQNCPVSNQRTRSKQCNGDTCRSDADMDVEGTVTNLSLFTIISSNGLMDTPVVLQLSTLRSMNHS